MFISLSLFLLLAFLSSVISLLPSSRLATVTTHGINRNLAAVSPKLQLIPPFQALVQSLAKLVPIAALSLSLTAIPYDAAAQDVLKGQCRISENTVSVIGGGPDLFQASVSPLPENDNRALYITGRQDNGVWSDRVRNFKPPPLFSKRISAKDLSSFPIEFTIDANADSTPEGIELASQWKGGQKPLLISARLDDDGVAATRSPNDLTGQATISFSNGKWDEIVLDLHGRGLTGKFITEKR